MKTKILCLVGASGSGKTTIANKLSETDKNINVIQSYTTREPRYEGEEGHIFLSDRWHPVYISKTFVGIENEGNPEYTDKGISHLFNMEDYEYIDIDDMIAYQELYGDYYFATDKQVIRDKTNIYVIDPQGVEQVKEYYKGTDVEVITVYLAADEEERVTRMIYRKVEDRQANKKVIDVGDRLKSDKKLFKSVKCDYCIDANRTMEEVADDVMEVIV